MTIYWKIGVRFVKWPPRYLTSFIYANLSAFISKVLFIFFLLFQPIVQWFFQLFTFVPRPKYKETKKFFGFCSFHSVIFIPLLLLCVVTIEMLITFYLFKSCTFWWVSICVNNILLWQRNQTIANLFPYRRYEREEWSVRLKFVARQFAHVSKNCQRLICGYFWFGRVLIKVLCWCSNSGKTLFSFQSMQFICLNMHLHISHIFVSVHDVESKFTSYASTRSWYSNVR